MRGDTYHRLLVTATVVCLLQTGIRARIEGDNISVTLPDWRPNSEYVAQCDFTGDIPPFCDWTGEGFRRLQTETDKYADAPEGVLVSSLSVARLESPTLDLSSEACLEFWYQAPAEAQGVDLRALLRDDAGQTEIWTSPAQGGDDWRQVFVPLITANNTFAQVVLEVVSSLPEGGKVFVDRVGVRRGPCGTQCDSDSQFWTNGKTLCACSAGQLSCSPSSSGLQRSSSPGTCTAHSDSYCSTFDGAVFSLVGTCSYVLAKLCSPLEPLAQFRVEVRSRQKENSSLAFIEQVNVKLESVRVSMLKRENHRVMVNGIWRKLPLNLNGGSLKVRSNLATVVLETNFGLFVAYDETGTAHVTVPASYSGKVCGMCGNFNEQRDDDLRTPDGVTAPSAKALARSWQSSRGGASCETPVVPHPCSPSQEAEYSSETYCGALISSTGPFAACLSVLGAESYFRSCVAGMCDALGDPSSMCDTMQDFTKLCVKAGVPVHAWRNSTICPLECGANSHYNACAEGCPEVCSAMDAAVAGPCSSCQERCECDAGFKLSVVGCVPAEDCGCWMNGNHYERGVSFMDSDCRYECSCMGNNNIRCLSTSCGADEVCTAVDGVHACRASAPVTCSVYGDPHYITFDDKKYIFQGGCSYTLATTCGGHTPVQFTVSGRNQNPGSRPWSTLDSVTLRVQELQMLLGHNLDVYVNGSLASLPTEYNGTSNGYSVRAFRKAQFVVVETDFGLKLQMDGEGRLFLQVDERYHAEMCGLCGTYSNDQEDDFLMPDGSFTSDSFEFGNSWREVDGEHCIARPSLPAACDPYLESEASAECEKLGGEAFRPCHGTLHAQIYMESCQYDHCTSGGDPHVLCASLETYVAACQVAGVELGDWRNGTACEVLPTPPTPAPSTPAPSTPDMTVCPLNCNFDDNLCDWEQLVQDSFDWTRITGPTPSDLTGPISDHTSGHGSYIYIEGDGMHHGDSARLLSASCQLPGQSCLQFYYHMHGQATAMALNIYQLHQGKATKIWSRVNNQGSSWLPAAVDVDVSGPYQIIIEAIRGSDPATDVAVDDISVQPGSCSGHSDMGDHEAMVPSVPEDEVVSLPVCDMDCSFDANLCSWDQMMTDAFDWTWQSGSTPTPMTGPSFDHTRGDAAGHYLYIEASGSHWGDTSRLISSECSNPGPKCLQFWYHMHGSAETMGLHVYLLQGRLADGVWWKRNDQGDEWRLAKVDLNTTGPFQIIFEGRRGSNEESDVAIDDVSLRLGDCAEGPLPPTTENPQYPTTGGPLPPTTGRPLPPTTGRPLPPTTGRPLPPTTGRPLPPTTGRPLPPTTGRPLPPTTERPLPPTTERPLPPTTERPLPPTTERPQPPTTERPLPPTTERPLPPTTERPLPPTTERPLPPTTERPLPPTTERPLPPTTERPLPPTTERPLPPTTERPLPPTTERPLPPTTERPLPPTTERPLPPTTERPLPPTTERPLPPTTERPLPPTTERPLPPTTERPLPPTTERPLPPTTERPLPPTTERPQPPTTVKPTPSCPKNSHYSTCISACQPTCKHLHGPPACQADEPCVEGCVCDDGFALKDRVCVPIQQCGCVDQSGNVHQFDEVWYTNHCSEKCECEKEDGVGEIDCDDEDCDGDSVCLQNEQGQFYCKSTDFSECSINGDPEYRTFDNMKHEFKGRNSYILVQTADLPKNLPEVHIEGINMVIENRDGEQNSMRDDSSSSSSSEEDNREDNDVMRLRSLKIRVYNHTVEFQKNRKLVLDGRTTRPPVSLGNGLQIRERSSRIYLKTDFGLSVEFDGNKRAEIVLPHEYKRKVGGLCGNFDGKRKNDLMKPSGDQAKNVQEFGESWRVPLHRRVFRRMFNHGQV